MGLGNGSGNKTYVSVVGGRLAIRVKEGTPGAIQRTTKDNKVVYEQQYQYLDGKITHISYDIKPFGAFINVEVDGKYVLSVPFKSSMKRNVISQLPNIDFAKDIKVTAFQDKDKKKNVILMYQDNEMVKFQHTKENPNGLPEPKEVVKLGKKEWDFSEVEQFMYDVLQQQIARFNKENGIEVATEEEPDGNDF